MRTTIDLPDDIHAIALSIARDRKQTLSQTVASLIRQGIGDAGAGERLSTRNGFLVLRTGAGPVTADDVRALDDE